MNKRAKTNTIRIIAGSWRGRRIPVLDHNGLRPTTDRVRETLFNWLMYDVNGAKCLDLFAGSGALGLECLSRNAEFVQFVEKDAKVANGLQKNLQSLLVDSVDGEKAGVSNSDACDFLSVQNHPRYDVVLLDPPFKANLLPRVISLLVANEWLNEGALVYLEYDSSDPSVSVPEDWSLYRQGKAGQSAYFLYTT